MVINRVRIGHILLTLGYLMNDNVPDVAPHCDLCNNAILNDNVPDVAPHCDLCNNAILTIEYSSGHLI